jgi:hypothetical protein
LPPRRDSRDTFLIRNSNISAAAPDVYSAVDSNRYQFYNHRDVISWFTFTAS